MKRVRVRVPASSANLGPGFDCLALALSLYHSLVVTEGPGEGVVVSAAGEGARELPLDETNIVVQAMRTVFAEHAYSAGRISIESQNEIPLSRGLGSSAAAVLAGMAAASLLAGGEIDQREIMALASAAEGHPDNVAASLVGGFCAVSSAADGFPEFIHLPVPETLGVVVVVPEFTVDTRLAREVLPDSLPFSDAAQNTGRAALLTAAMAAGRADLLHLAMEDRLHQVYRSTLVPGLDSVVGAAREAGAYGAALSGSGPTVLALIKPGDEEPGAAMQSAWRQLGIESRVMALDIDRNGLQAEHVG